MLQPFDDWEVPMDKYICDVCGYIYDPAVGDPDGGITAGTAFEDIPETGLPRMRRWQGRLLAVHGIAPHFHPCQAQSLATVQTAQPPERRSSKHLS